MAENFRKFLWPYGLVILLAGLSLVFQIHNISKYNVYPDSYQSVTVAQNLKEYHRLAAPMGDYGLVYPDFFGWTRPFYPLLILLLSLFGFSLFTAGHIVAIAAGTLAVFVVFVLVSSVLRSKKAGVFASLLLAISYSHALWSGFIFTETLGVLMLSLAMWSLWANRAKNEGWFTKSDILTGLLFALAVLTRYEYIVLLIPAAFLAGNKLSIKRTVSILIINITVVIFVLTLLKPFTGDFSWIWNQVNEFVYLIIAALAAVSFGLALLNFHKNKFPELEKWTSRAILLALILGSLAIILRHSIYPGLWDFIINDPLLCYVSLFGMFVLLTGTKDQKRLGLILFSGLVILIAVYYQVNPHMERYVSHLTSLLLIAAGAGILKLAALKSKPIILIFLVLVICAQSIKSWTGLHNVNNDIWYKPSYEELSAKKLKNKISSTNLLIASMPEPYYLFTGIATQSIADQKPYIFADIPPSTKLTIVEDEGMRHIFPNFTKFIDQNLSSYKTSEYSVGEVLRYKTSFIKEDKPVMVYEINSLNLRKLLDNTDHKH